MFVGQLVKVKTNNTFARDYNGQTGVVTKVDGMTIHVRLRNSGNIFSFLKEELQLVDEFKSMSSWEAMVEALNKAFKLRDYK